MITGLVLLIAGSITTYAVHDNPNLKKTIGWDHGFKLTQFESKTVNLTPKQLKSVSFNLSDFDVKIVKGDKFSLKIQSPTDMMPTVSGVDTGALALKDNNRHVSFLNVSFEVPKQQVTLTVPEDTNLDKLVVNTDNGAITVNGIKSADTDLETDNGRLSVEDSDLARTTISQENGILNVVSSHFTSLHMENDNGTIKLDGVSATMPTKIGNENGKIIISNSDLTKLNVHNQNGTIAVTNLTITENSRITNENGHLTFNSLTNDGYLVNSDNGSITVDGKHHSNIYHSNTTGPAILNVTTENGGVTINN
jgi:hypothetical protein